MANGIPPIKSAEYGDKIKVEKLVQGFKNDPATSTPEFTDRSGGRPRAGGTPRPASSGAPPAVAASQQTVIPPEHEELFQRAASSIYAYGYIASWAQMPSADPRLALIAQAGGAHEAVAAARTGTPFFKLR